MNTPIELTWDEANALLDRAVEERGADYVYERQVGASACMYFHESGEPGCIIGLVLSYKGLAEVAGATNSRAVNYLQDEGYLKADHKTLYLLRAVQRNQDRGQAWGKALKNGRDEVDYCTRKAG